MRFCNNGELGLNTIENTIAETLADSAVTYTNHCPDPVSIHTFAIDGSYLFPPDPGGGSTSVSISLGCI